ncbi:hypothetical protein EOD39_0916 [Acipenser ruthenus]|uniref:Uncharacterized protein n=1 Tax=Acipenser ruthenus TaxID=7906 RepID=A0A444UK21_ACIRT|nr:hypothetical protein EOD39_0916 [Acipenser ruthenus]
MEHETSNVIGRARFQLSKSHAEGRRSLTAKRMGPSWDPQRAMPDSRSKEWFVRTCPGQKWSPEAEHRGPGWVLQSAVPDARSQARPRADQPDGNGSAAGRRGAKLPSFDGTTSWEAFHAQLSMLGGVKTTRHNS